MNFKKMFTIVVTSTTLAGTFVASASQLTQTVSANSNKYYKVLSIKNYSGNKTKKLPDDSDAMATYSIKEWANSTSNVDSDYDLDHSFTIDAGAKITLLKEAKVYQNKKIWTLLYVKTSKGEKGYIPIQDFNS